LIRFYRVLKLEIWGGEVSFVKVKLNEAWRFLKAAEEEFAEAKEDPLRIRDVAEKAWNAVVQAADALIYALTGVRVMSNYERRMALRDIGKRRVDVKSWGLGTGIWLDTRFHMGKHSMRGL